VVHTNTLENVLFIVQAWHGRRLSFSNSSLRMNDRYGLPPARRLSRDEATKEAIRVTHARRQLRAVCCRPECVPSMLERSFVRQSYGRVPFQPFFRELTAPRRVQPLVV
jgi:hypothetical protein